ncbi:MAG: alpha/beta hydrolase [Clostridia bacterium]|nr:alpha/beta hydrolase [Clostridia bacterium]
MNYKIIEGSKFQTVNGNETRDYVVFLHGWGGSVSAFLFVAKRLATLGYRCILLDMAGFGDTPEPTFPYTVKAYANDVRRLLYDLGIEKAVFVGQSFGGRIATELAYSSPDTVKKLVLIDAAGCKPRRGLKYRLRVFAHKFLQKIGKKGLKGSRDYQVLSPVMRETFKNVVNYFQDGQLEYIVCPTAIFWGKNDKETPLYMAKRLKKRIKNSQLFLLDGGHFAYMDDFFRFFAVFSAFLKE